jgi:alpha-L-fucosidase 2
MQACSRPISRRTFVAAAAAAGAALTIGPRDLLAHGDSPPSSRPPASPQPSPAASVAPPVTLRYRRPAQDFSQALPIGNGRLGAMVYGGVPRDRLSLNHSGLWRRHHRNTTVPVSAHLAEIRRLARAGHWREAEQLCLETLQPYVPELHATWSKASGVTPERTINAYQPAGNVVIAIPDGRPPDDYERVLDLPTGIATVRYRVDDVQFTREYFSVVAPSVIVARLTASRRRR